MLFFIFDIIQIPMVTLEDTLLILEGNPDSSMQEI